MSVRVQHLRTLRTLFFLLHDRISISFPWTLTPTRRRRFISFFSIYFLATLGSTEASSSLILFYYCSLIFLSLPAVGDHCLFPRAWFFILLHPPSQPPCPPQMVKLATLQLRALRPEMPSVSIGNSSSPLASQPALRENIKCTPRCLKCRIAATHAGGGRTTWEEFASSAASASILRQDSRVRGEGTVSE